MRRLHLSTLLLALNATLVALAVVCVAAAASGLLGRLAAEQALARVGLAGAGAVEAVERSAGDVRTSALLLSERPTVVRLARAGDSASLAAFLERFQRTSRLGGCAILSSGRPLAAAGPPLPWASLAAAVPPTAGTAATADGGLALLRPGTAPGSGPPLLVALAPVPELPGASALAVLPLDSRFVAATSGQVGLPVAVLTAEETRARPEASAAELRERALESGRPAAGRVEGGAFVSVAPLAFGGRPAALVETTLPAGAVTPSLARVERSLLWVALATAVLATLSGLLVGRRLARPVKALTDAAERIGRGDLATPLLTSPEAAPGAEIGTLAATMDSMRRRLLALTAELKRRQAEAEAVLTGIAEGVFAVDGDRRIRYLNPQAAAMLGIAPGNLDAVLGRFCGDVLNPQGLDGVRPCDEQCPIVHARFRGGARATEHLLTPAGERRTVVVTSSPPAEGRQFQVMRDETETEAARRLRDTVFANISHEFKTPLAAQLASLELLRERMSGKSPALAGGEAAGLVASLERGTLRLTQLVDNLLESVRLEAGQHDIRRRPVALDEVVEEAVELTSPLLGLRSQRVAVDLPYPLPEVVGDAPRLTQVFVNLLANANKFAPGSSTIMIGGAVAERTVSLWVEDEGPGLPEEGGGELFERFVRTPGRGAGNLGQEPEQSGMGLGLWIVKSIVERHGGSVDALPVAAGVGTRMRVTLPRGERDEREERDEEPAA